MCGILFGVSEDLQRNLQCLVRKWQVILPGCPQTPVQCSDLKRNSHQAFSRGLELGHQMCAQTLGDKSPYAADLSVSEQEESLPVGRKDNLSVRRRLGRGGGRSLFQGHLYPNIEPGGRSGCW